MHWENTVEQSTGYISLAVSKKKKFISSLRIRLLFSLLEFSIRCWNPSFVKDKNNRPKDFLDFFRFSRLRTKVDFFTHRSVLTHLST